MNVEVRPVGATASERPQPVARSMGTPPTQLSEDSRLAVEVRTLVEQGQLEQARERFGGLVAWHQRRALRIAFQYLHNAADADEAVQDAFVKVFSHIGSYREAWPFEVWFTRVLINGCLDRRQARARLERWFVSPSTSDGNDRQREPAAPVAETSPELGLLARERHRQITAAVSRLEGRQKTVFVLCHFGDCTAREISAITGLNESTVRVHLFRAVRKLRSLLGGNL